MLCNIVQDDLYLSLTVFHTVCMSDIYLCVENKCDLKQYWIKTSNVKNKTFCWFNLKK